MASFYKELEIESGDYAFADARETILPRLVPAVKRPAPEDDLFGASSQENSQKKQRGDQVLPSVSVSEEGGSSQQESSQTTQMARSLKDNMSKVRDTTFDVSSLDLKHLIHIFSFLTPSEREIASNVCQSWKRMYNKFWKPAKCISSAKFFLPGNVDVPEDERLSKACVNFERLVKVGEATIKRVEVNHTNFLEILLKYRFLCLNLEELKLHYVDEVPSKIFIHKVFRNLKVLDLHHCGRGFTELRIGTAIRNLPKLHTLITHSHMYKGIFLRGGMPASLKTLYYCLNSINSVMYLQEGLQKNAQCKLQHLTLTFRIHPWTPKHGAEMFQVCRLLAPTLTSFKTIGEIDYRTKDHNTQDPETYEEYFERPFQPIRPCVEGFSRLANLRELKLYDNTYSAAQMEILYRNCNKIVKLELNGTQKADKLRAMSHLSNLKMLSLAVNTISKDTFDIIAQNFPKLEYFFCKNYNLYGDADFDIETFKGFLLKCEYLKVLKMTDTFKFRDELSDLQKEIQEKRSTHIPIVFDVDWSYNPFKNADEVDLF